MCSRRAGWFELHAYQLSHWSVRWPALKSKHEADAERVGHPLERFDTRLVTAALETRDSRVARPDAASQLLLEDPESRSMADDEASHVFERGQTLLVTFDGRYAMRPPMEGDGMEEVVIVEAFGEALPGERCEGLE